MNMMNEIFACRNSLNDRYSKQKWTTFPTKSGLTKFQK